MYSLCHQLHPSTVVEQSLFCQFVEPGEDNLVVAGVDQLSVYKLNPDIESSSKTQEKSAEKLAADVKSKKKKLECIGTYQLFGNIESMAKVCLAGSQTEGLLLSFFEAKLSLLEFDPSTHDLKTTSLHFFEDEELKEGLLGHSNHVPYIRVDPMNRCAAVIIYGNYLAILPFRKETIAEGEAGDGVVTVTKSPVMSSYIIHLHKMDEKIINVVDIQFLHGYYEPTILVLYEPLPTWTGRVAVRKDSCSIVAISINILERTNPIIWALGGLPYDSLQAIAVPKPIGGVLIFAVNSLLYLNQSFPPYGVALNSITMVSTDFLLKPQANIKITLDCAQAAFITDDKLVLSLRGGEIYVLTLLVDSMRAMRGFHLDKAAASVLTTCMTHCGDGYLFLGSRLGNSLLLKYTEKSTDTPAEIPKVKLDPIPELDEPQTKKRKDDIGDWMATDVSRIDDLDELEVYGASNNQQSSGGQIKQYTFEVCDSIMNIGPCTRTVMGEPAFLSEEFSNSTDPDIELVTTSGFGKNGAISVLQRSIRPQVVTTFELPGCLDMWTVVGAAISSKKETTEEPAPETSKEDDEEEKEKEKETPVEEEELENAHALLILSREDSTLILQTGHEIMELDHSGFGTQGPTVYAGNIGGNTYILQVSALGVRLLEGVTQLQHLVLDLGSPIVCCSVADPHVVLMSEEGQVVLLTLKQENSQSGSRLHISRPNLHQGSKILTLCAYKDFSGMFTTRPLTGDQPADQTASVVPKVEDAPPISFDDDEDELLYGAGPRSLPRRRKANSTAQPIRSDVSTDSNGSEIDPTFWLSLARDNGVLEMYTLPELKLCFTVKNFPMGLKVLVDSTQQTELGSKTGSSLSCDKLTAAQDMPAIKELLIVGLGHWQSRPHLMARADEDLYIYEAFSHFGSGSSATDSHLKLRFRKLQHTLILKEKKLPKTKKKDVSAEEGGGNSDRVHWLRPFVDISGYSGVFVCGPYPHWLFMTARGIFRYHPMSIDGAVTCFTPFHNINCPKGFLYFNRKGELRISVLPTHLSYDAPWPVRKVPLRCTPHFVLYHPESKTYSVVSSTAETCNRVVKLLGEGDKEFETQEKDERFIYPVLDKFNIQLFSPVSWEPIPNTKIEFEDFEHVTAIKNVVLKSEGTYSGLKGYIAVGTNFTYNEEVTSRGRIIIYDVIEVVPEPGQPLTKNKMKVEYDKEQKGPVTALEHVQGFLISAMGQKIYIWQLKDQDLSGVAFIDTQVYVHSLCTIKNLILAADIRKSVILLRYQEDMKVLSLVSRDVKPLEVYEVAYLVDNTTLSFLVSDRDKNILIYTYQPEVRESHSGQRLLCRGDFNVGSHINTFFRMKLKLSDPSTGRAVSGIMEKRHITYYATLDGGIGYILPITEKMYRRLSMVQNTLNTHIPHIGGLNPKAHRAVRYSSQELSNPQKNVLDGDLLVRFVQLSVPEKNELAKRIGTTSEQIVEDLMEIDRYTAHF